MIRPRPNDIGFDYSFIMPATADRVPTLFIENRKTNLAGRNPAWRKWRRR